VISGTGISNHHISEYMCGARRVVRGLCCSQHPPPMDVPMNDPDTCTSYERSRWTRTRCWIIHGPMLVCSSTPAYTLPGSYPGHLDVSIQGAATMSKPGGGNVTDRESNPRPVGASSGDSTTHLKRSAVISGTGIHRLVYRDMCVERGASYAACPAAHNIYVVRFPQHSHSPQCVQCVCVCV